MYRLRKLTLALVLGVFMAIPSMASDTATKQSLQLEAVDVSSLALATVENEANKNADEIHQESMVGRAGLQGACRCFPDGMGGFFCQ